MRLLFVDHVLELVCRRRVVAALTLSADEEVFALHFPANPVLPASMLMECFAQTATVLLEVSSGFTRKGLPGFIQNAKFRRPVKPGARLEHALFLDLETCGLSSSTVFLAGTMHWNGEDFVLRQYFARHYGEEGPLLRALNESMAGFEHLVTFNGKTFDVPFLQGRAVVHGERLALPPHHLDLLHPSRRRWRGEFTDCRLKTLESRVCGRHRVGDVPGEEIPGLYHDYVKHGDPYRLVPVFHHNLLDVITMSDILRALCRPARPDAAKARRGA